MSEDDSRAIHDWLTAEYFTKVLRECFNEPELEITSLHIEPAIPKGENYTSLMFRITIRMKRTTVSHEERISLVCKTPTRDVIFKKSMEDFGFSIFAKEANNLQNIMPKIDKILKDAGLIDEPPHAECLYYGTEPAECVLFQDLKEVGYVSANRKEGLDWNGVKLVLEGLAKLHVASIAALEKYPNLYDDDIGHPWIKHRDSKASEVMDGMLKSSITTAREEAARVDDFPKHYLEKLLEIENSPMDRLIEILSPNEKSIDVLIHGDCWISNFMFTKGNDGQFNKMKFVDFQLCSYVSRASDLNYFLFLSPKPDIRFKIIDDALAFYHKVFTSTAEKLGVKLPEHSTYEDLKADFHRLNYFGLMSFLTLYPITIAEVENVVGIDQLLDKNDGKGKMYKNPVFLKVFKDAMSYCFENGAL